LETLDLLKVCGHSRGAAQDYGRGLGHHLMILSGLVPALERGILDNDLVLKAKSFVKGTGPMVGLSYLSLLFLDYAFDPFLLLLRGFYILALLNLLQLFNRLIIGHRGCLSHVDLKTGPQHRSDTRELSVWAGAQEVSKVSYVVCGRR